MDTCLLFKADDALLLHISGSYLKAFATESVCGGGGVVVLFRCILLKETGTVIFKYRK